MAYNPKSKANLKPPWQPGEVTNPKGRPKGSLNLRTILEELFEEDVEYVKPNGEEVILPQKAAILKTWMRTALKSRDPLKDPDWRAAQALYEIIEGKPTTRNELTGADGQPVDIQVTPEFMQSLNESFEKFQAKQNNGENDGSSTSL